MTDFVRYPQNRQYTVPGSCTGTATENDDWQGSSSSSSGPCSNPSLAPVLFEETVTINSGDVIYIVGSISQLGSWNTSQAIQLSPPSSGYAYSDPSWSVTVRLPTNTSVQYKYFRMNNGTTSWECDPVSRASASRRLYICWRIPSR